MNLCSSYSHLLSTHVCALPTRFGRAECRVHLLFSISRWPRCIAAVCWFLLWGCVFRPDDACQKRFSRFSDWIQKVQQLESNVGRNLENHPGAVQKLDSEVGKSVERAVQKCADLVDLENAENCAYSRYQRRRYSRERALQSFSEKGGPEWECQESDS